MRLATFIAPGGAGPRAGDVRGDEIVAFADGVTVAGLIATGDRPAADGERHRLDEVALLAPYVPRVVFGIGLNYPSHAAEGGAELPSVPVVFLKGPASVTAPAGPVVRPAGVELLDYEGELALVVGPGETIAGYAVADDVSARDFLSDGQLTRHKGGDSFCPWGPWVTTADEVDDPYDLRLRTWVDDELRQDGNTGEMVFKAPEIVDAIGRTIRLQPGDVILTGTPAGVGFLCDPPRGLQPGQRVRVEIDGLGAIEHAIEDAAC